MKNRTKHKFIKKAAMLLLSLTLLYTLIPPLGASALETRDNTVIASRFGELFFGKEEKFRPTLYPGGEIFGVKLSGCGISVSRIVTDGECPFAIDDKIICIDGQKIETKEDFDRIYSEGEGDITIDISRAGKPISITLSKEARTNFSSLGIIISDSAAGIGTITFIEKDSGAFGGLGHGVTDSERGDILPMKSGMVSGVMLGGANRGEVGKPGELRGILTRDMLGTIEQNTPMGVFGHLNGEGINKKCTSEPMEIAFREEVKAGEAEIISTIKNGKRATYKIEIYDIDYKEDGAKAFHIRVTDPTLIAMTGGIVRGMSGSPIIQEGRIVGAVTHVMIQNPEEGYGIFIENMLSVAKEPLLRAA